MATTFHVTNFKNKTLDLLTGVNTSVTPIGFVVPYNGAQPADPSATPAGTASFSAITSGPNLSGDLSAAGGGISQLAGVVAPVTPANGVAVASLTFARIYTTTSLPLIDAPVSLAGGGGEVTLSSLTSVVSVGMNVDGFSLKMPMDLGTLFLSASLANRLVDMWCGGSSTSPNMGNVTGGACALTLYSGSPPASADAPASGTVLATFSMTSTNLWAAAVGGASGLNGTGPSVTASGTGTATYFRMVKTNSTSTFTLQGTVGTVSGASDMLISTTALTSGVTSVQITDTTISI
jgi:hypothetical protein